MAKAERKPPTTHKLCGKTLAVPPSLCMRCFIAADIRRAVVAERRRVLGILRHEQKMYRAAHLPYAPTALGNVIDRVRKGGRGER